MSSQGYCIYIGELPFGITSVLPCVKLQVYSTGSRMMRRFFSVFGLTLFFYVLHRFGKITRINFNGRYAHLYFVTSECASNVIANRSYLRLRKSKPRTLCQSRRQRWEIQSAYLQWCMSLFPRPQLETRVQCALILTNQSKPTLKCVYLPEVRAARELRL